VGHNARREAPLTFAQFEAIDEAMLEAPLNALASALEPIGAELKKLDDQKRKTEASKNAIIRNVAKKIADNPKLSKLFERR
jgi:hypothetical protein